MCEAVTPGRAAGAAGLLVLPLGNGDLDAAVGQVTPVRRGGVGLVGQHPVRAGARPGGSTVADPDDVEHGVKNEVSAAFPPVSSSPSGLPLPSVARCILQVTPPRERPIG